MKGPHLPKASTAIGVNYIRRSRQAVPYALFFCCSLILAAAPEDLALAFSLLTGWITVVFMRGRLSTKSLAQDKASEAAAPSFAPAAADNGRRPLINHRVRTNLLKRWYRALSCALQRGNAQILRHNLVTAREIAGRGPTTTLFHLNNFVA